MSHYPECSWTTKRNIRKAKTEIIELKKNQHQIAEQQTQIAQKYIQKLNQKVQEIEQWKNEQKQNSINLSALQTEIYILKEYKNKTNFSVFTI